MPDQSSLRLDRRHALAGGSALAAALAFRAGSAQGTPGATPSASAGLEVPGIEAALAEAAPDFALLVGEVVDGEVVPLLDVNADLVLPIGSSFKFWILAALTEQVEQGILGWEQVVVIEEPYKSVPGGDLRYALDGTQYTMRYLAERMMQKSDNTATDHMLHLAGRENVETMMATTIGIADPSPNLPMISTRELAMLKFAYPTDKLDAYYAADIDEQRRILAEEIAAIPYSALEDIDQTAPLEIDRVEWFANRDDLARTMVWLWEASQREGLLPAKEVIALETQLRFDGEIWPYVGFKGGSEMGVLAGSWIMQRADDRMFIFTIGFRNETGEVDTPAAVVAMEQVRDAMATIP
jgi:beta-lactamase class A